MVSPSLTASAGGRTYRGRFWLDRMSGRKRLIMASLGLTA